MRFDLATLNAILACPQCRAPLALEADADLLCATCNSFHRRLPFTWELIPSRWRNDPAPWAVWDELQQNGVVSYRSDPTRNLGVEKREDYLAFSRFCAFEGLVLDVGCGPQPWPTHFEFHKPGTQFFGVDPLVGDAPADYVQLRALGEWLPFRDRAFDHVSFATSLDHFLDPTLALLDASRVVKRTGTVEVWLGEKQPGAPKPKESPEWYRRLNVPQGAEDPFHLHRPTVDEIRGVAASAGLVLVDEKLHRVDEWRTNGFLRFAPA